MILKDFLENINKLVEENPGLLDKKVIYSIDDEWNAFKNIHYTPSIWMIDKENEFIQNTDEEFEWEINCICIN